MYSYRHNPDLDFFREEIKVMLSNIVTAFDAITIGSKVKDPNPFMELVLDAIETFDFEAQRVPGQGFIILPPESANFVSAGVATKDPKDKAEWYVCRKYREGVKAYLRRDIAERQGRNPATGCAVVVYTKDAYLADPDILHDPDEAGRAAASDATHFLVAVIAFAGPESPLPPFRFVANLAGGNKEALLWDADTIRDKAKQIYDYFSQYTMVAD